MNDILFAYAHRCCNYHVNNMITQVTWHAYNNSRPGGVIVVLVKLTDDPLAGLASTVQM